MKSVSHSSESKNEIFVLERMFRSNQARVLDFLILNDKFDYSFADISKYTGIPLRTLQRTIPILIEEGLVKKTRQSGKNFMYVFNRNIELGNALVNCVQVGIKQNILNKRKLSHVTLKEKSNERLVKDSIDTKRE